MSPPKTLRELEICSHGLMMGKTGQSEVLYDQLRTFSLCSSLSLASFLVLSDVEGVSKGEIRCIHWGFVEYVFMMGYNYMAGSYLIKASNPGIEMAF